MTSINSEDHLEQHLQWQRYQVTHPVTFVVFALDGCYTPSLQGNENIHQANGGP